MMSKKIIAMLTVLVMVLGCTGALAENTKHERVYVVAGADGTVTSITDSIRLENTDGLDELADRTMLNGIQNVGGNEAFTLEGETLTWKADGKNVIYQGTSDKVPAVLPVVTLTLDGEEISAVDLKEKTDVITDVRGCGAMIGVELNINGTQIVQKCMENGLLINCTHGTVLRLLPAITLTEDLVNQGCDVMSDVILSL